MTDSSALIDEFLCRALRGEPAPWAALQPEPEQQKFIERVGHHGVGPLLCSQLGGKPEWQGWPDSIRKALEGFSRVAVARDLLRGHHLTRLLDEFSRRRIHCLLSKGEALAASHYPVPGTRPRCDADIFIPVTEVSATRQAVLDAGYHIVSPVFKSHQFTARRSPGGVDAFEFDVHWRLLNNPQFARVLSFETLFERSIEVPGRLQTRALCPVDALLLACMHRVGSELHDRRRLIWLYDIHLLLSGMTPAELTEFAQRAVEFGVHAACQSSVLLVQACFATALPERVSEVLATAEPPATLSRRFAESNLGLLLDDWRTLPGWRERVALLRELFLPAATELRGKYGERRQTWLPWLYLRHITRGLAQRLTLK